MKIEITKDPYYHALRLGKKVFNNKLARGKRNVESKNLQSDLYNFILQSVISNYFNSKLPEFGEPYKLLINDKNLDVKKVNYDNLSQRTIGRINKHQHDSNIGKQDGYLFSSIAGDFRQSLFSGYEIYLPIPTRSSVLLWGWDTLDNITKNGKTYTKTNKYGKEIYSFYYVAINSLKPISKI